MKKVVTLESCIVAESGIQVKRLREFIVGVEVKYLVTLQIHIFLHQEYKYDDCCKSQ